MKKNSHQHNFCFKSSVSVSVALSATLYLLVDRGEIRDVKVDKRRFERVVFSFEILIYLETFIKVPELSRPTCMNVFKQS